MPSATSHMHFEMKLKESFPIVFHFSEGDAASMPALLSKKPHLAKDIEGLVIRLPWPYDASKASNLAKSLHMCENLKEMVFLVFRKISWNAKFRRFAFMPASTFHYKPLTKFVNGYFSQNGPSWHFRIFLTHQPNLESLELHSGETDIYIGEFSLPSLKTLACPPRFLNTSYNVTRLRLDFKNSKEDCEIDVLQRYCAEIAPDT